MKHAEGRRHTEPALPEDRPRTAGSVKTNGSVKTEGQRFDFFLKTNLNFRSRTDLPTPDAVEEK